MTIRIELPAHLRALARIPTHEVNIEVSAEPTIRTVLDALEAAYPSLRGTIRDQGTLKRRAFLRFFACRQDISHTSVDEPLPATVANAAEPLIILGAVAGGSHDKEPRTGCPILRHHRRVGYRASLDALLQSSPPTLVCAVTRVDRTLTRRWSRAADLDLEDALHTYGSARL